jgi:hypothetical protein
MCRKILGLAMACAMSMVSPLSAQQPDMITDLSVLAKSHKIPFHQTPHDLTNGNAHSRFGIFGIDSIPNFNGQFFADGFDWQGKPNRHWYTNTVGNPPQMGGTTVIGAPIQPVNVELDDANGNLVTINGRPMISPATPFVSLVLNSPVFSPATYTSSDVPTQFSDAVHRAQFFNHMKPDWHTLLNPRVLPPLTMHLRQAPGCPSGPNFAGCNYVFALKPDGTCCSVILAEGNTFFSILFDLAVFDAQQGLITTKDISTALLPNTFAFYGDITNCCTLGLHNYIFEPNTDPEKRWVVNFSSWISPGSPIGQFFVSEDIDPLSHEMTEIYNDPFIASDGIHNAVPWWLAPNGNCQANLETGDVSERLPNAQFPMFVNGFLYHPQNETLRQWFEFQSPSDALGGAYSYPDMSVLTKLSAPRKANCLP